MYIYIICIHIFRFTCIYACIYIYIYIRIYMCTHISILLSSDMYTTFHTQSLVCYQSSVAQTRCDYDCLCGCVHVSCVFSFQCRCAVAQARWEEAAALPFIALGPGTLSANFFPYFFGGKFSEYGKIPPLRIFVAVSADTYIFMYTHSQTYQHVYTYVYTKMLKYKHIQNNFLLA